MDDIKFNKLMSKLHPVDRPNYVADPYNHEDIIQDVAESSKMLSPDDVRQISNIESSGGKDLINRSPGSTARGTFQFVDKRRQDILDNLKNQGVDVPVNPDRQDSLLMQEQINKIEQALQNSRTGEKEPNLRNVYLMHKYGIQGGLNALNQPKNPESNRKFKIIDKLLGKQPLSKEEKIEPAQNLLDLLED